MYCGLYCLNLLFFVCGGKCVVNILRIVLHYKFSSNGDLSIKKLKHLREKKITIRK